MWKKRLTQIFIGVVTLFIAYVLYDYFLVPVKVLEDDKIVVAEKTEYGIVADSLVVHKSEVQANDNISSILQKYTIDSRTVDQIVRKSDTIFDFHKIRPGDSYTVLCSNDNKQTVQYFIYENSPVSYIVYDLRDSVHIHYIQRNVDKNIKTISGEITSSLWSAMTNAKASPSLAVELSEIYAWTIDFYSIQPGDKFKVIYEELSVDNETIDLDRILGAWFYHAGKPYYAFYFAQDNAGDYFDDLGQSLKRAFLKAPLKFSRISSNFTYHRFHPILRIVRPHLGVDYSAPRGTSVHSIGNGTVISAGFAGGAGRMVKIRHNAVYSTTYMHLAKFGSGIRSGAHVTQGQVIGYVGSSGLSTGSHLDFRFYKNGKPINPLKVESPPAKPVKKEYYSDYARLRDKLKHQLDSIK